MHHNHQQHYHKKTSLTSSPTLEIDLHLKLLANHNEVIPVVSNNLLPHHYHHYHIVITIIIIVITFIYSQSYMILHLISGLLVAHGCASTIACLVDYWLLMMLKYKLLEIIIIIY